MKKREADVATEKIAITDLFDKFLPTYKQTHICINGQQVQIECLRPWREIKKGKENAATKSEARKLLLRWKMNVKNFLSKPVQRKVSYLFY